MAPQGDGATGDGATGGWRHRGMAPQRADGAIGDGATEGRWRHRGTVAPQSADGTTGGWRHTGPMALHGDGATECRWRQRGMAPLRADGATGEWRHRGPMAPQRDDGATEGQWRHAQGDDGCSERTAADQLSSFYPVLTIYAADHANDCTANVIVHVAKCT
jgi:hypothetical protein